MNTFADFNLIKPLQHTLAKEKYETPTCIQSKTIPAALDGNDILGCAQTGTGKTAAFALPILNRLAKRKPKLMPNQPLALILAPTRELAIQIEKSLEKYGGNLRIRRVIVYGGVSQLNQVRKLDRGAHILVATPGRLLDLMEQGHVQLNKLEVFVLDEADRMLDMGFLPDLKKIIRHLPTKRQSLFFSATIPPKIEELSQRLLTNPLSVNVAAKKPSVEGIQQRVLFTPRSQKQKVLQSILVQKNVTRAIVFTKTKRGANRLAEKLAKQGIESDAIHGDKSQRARELALTAFRRKRIRVLVATDVAARGIDVAGISHVVNFDLPNEPENYIHRIGRTGRAGAEGIAISFCSETEYGELNQIEKLIGHRIPKFENSQPDFNNLRDRESTFDRSSRELPEQIPGKNRRRRRRKPLNARSTAAIGKSTSGHRRRSRQK